MLLIRLSLFILCIAASRSFNPCDPRVSTTCIAQNRAIKTTYTEDLQSASKLFTTSDDCPSICHGPEGANLTVLKRFDNPRLFSETYLMYGKVELEMKGAAGKGLISSFYLLSDDQDEIDIVELFGDEHQKYETNYFTKGQSVTDGDGTYINVQTSPIDNFHKYGVVWTAEKIEWQLDGKVVRQILESESASYPNSPMRLLVSLWAGGDSGNENGTIEWAGGLTDYQKLPFTMLVKNLVVENYSKGEYYEYTNNTSIVTHETELKVSGASNSSSFDYE